MRYVAQLVRKKERAEGRVAALKEVLRNLLRHCDVKSDGETEYERDVIAARKVLSEPRGSNE